MVHWTRSDVRQEKSCLIFLCKISADSDHMCPICILNGWNKKVLVIGSDSFQIVDEGEKKTFLDLVMGDFSTQMYVERKI